MMGARGRCRRFPRLGRVFLFLLLLCLAGLPDASAGKDPPIRMEEATPESLHVDLHGRGMWGYADAGGEYALVATGGALEVVDVTDPARPVRASRVASIGADLKEVKTYKHYAYCVNQGGPLQIVDLADPYHAYTAAGFISSQIPGAHNIWITGDGYAYLALQGAGLSDLRILDLTADPLRPVERGSWQHAQQSGFISAHDVFVRNDTCFASWFGGGLVLLNVRSKDYPSLLVNINYPSPATHNAWPTADGRYVCTTDEQNGGHLRIWDIRDPFIRQVADYEASQSAIIHNVHIKGSTAYIAYYTAGVRVVDLSDPRRPREIGAFDTSRYAGSRFGGCWSIFPYAPSGLIYASDMEEGLYVLRFLDARDGIVRGTVSVHGAEAARVEGAEIVFDGESGVRAVSDRTGYFQVRLDAGPHTGRISRSGFHSEDLAVSVARDEAVSLVIALDPEPGRLELPDEELPVPVELADGRLLVEARVRAHSTPVAAVTLRYRSGGAGGFRALAMERVAADGENYRATVPDQLPGTLLQYFVEAADAGGHTIFAPTGAPAALAGYRVGELDWTPVLATDFEADAAGFTVGSPDDSGARGVWERAIPAAPPPDSLWIGGRLAQPDADATATGPGTCFLTENGSPGAPPGENEVEGRTTLVAPPVDLRRAAAARLRFALWYVNDLAGSTWQDPFLVEGSSDGGATWRVLESIRVFDPGWREVTVDLGRRLELGGAVQVRFVAEDGVSPSLVEAAVDDVRIETTTGLTVRDLGGRPEVVRLRQNAPNPFNPATVITYQLKEARRVRLGVYDAGGHLVRILVDGVEPVGDRAVSWDGRNVRGFAAPSGVYIYRLDAGDVTQSRKMLLVK